jgi:IS30 family transposase
MFEIGKHLTREERRKIQRFRANLISIGMIAALVLTGVLIGWSL